MPSERSVYFISRLMPGADTLSSFAAPPIVPVIITALITSTWRSVIICSNSEDEPERYSHVRSAQTTFQTPSRDRAITFRAASSARWARSFGSQGLGKLGGRDFDADGDIGRHGAGQRHQVDAAFARKQPLMAGGVDQFFVRRGPLGRAVA